MQNCVLIIFTKVCINCLRALPKYSNSGNLRRMPCRPRRIFMQVILHKKQKFLLRVTKYPELFRQNNLRKNVHLHNLNLRCKNTPGGLGSYIDHLQAHIGEVESMVPDEYYDAKNKRLLLMNIRDADGVAHL